MRRALPVLIILMAALSGCRWDYRPAAPPALPPPRPGPILDRDDQVRLIVFQELRRRREEYYLASAPARVRAFYLSLWSEEADNDPGNDLLASLGAGGIPLNKVSQCLTETPQGAVRCVDRATFQLGCILWVGDVNWLDDDAAELEAGYWEGGLAFGSQTVQVRWRNSHWELRYTKAPGAP